MLVYVWSNEKQLFEFKMSQATQIFTAAAEWIFLE